METLLQDLKYGARLLLKSPAFTAVAALTLALGIGATTAIFSVINAVMLRSLGAVHQEQLAIVGDPGRVHSVSGGTPQLGLFSYPLYRELRDNNRVFSSTYASGDTGRLTAILDESAGNKTTERLRGRIVSGTYFPLLGVDAVLGRVLNPSDDQSPGASPVAVISAGLWKRRFGLDPHVIGRVVRLNDYPVTIVGVAPAQFAGDIAGERYEVWVPMSLQAQIMPGRSWLENPNVSWLQVMGRLNPSVSLAQAQANLNVVFQQAMKGAYGARLTQDDRESIKDRKISVVSGARGFSGLRESFSDPLLVLMGIVALVLLIACVNVANLQLARASLRQKEIAIRLAIGAGPIRVLRQLLTESVLLAFLGGAMALLLANWGTVALLNLVAAGSVRNGLDTSPDLRVLGFTAVVCMVTGILFGLVPALRALHIEVVPSLKLSAASTRDSGVTGRRWSIAKTLVAGQVAISLLVLFTAGLLVRTLRNLRTLDAGYERQHLLVTRLDVIGAGYKGPQISAVAQQLLEQLSALPGVIGATVSENGLFSGTESGETINVDGYKPGKDDDRQAAFDQVAPGYFKTVGISLLRGREFTDADAASAPRVAVINQTMADFYFKGQDPIGRRFRPQSDTTKDAGIEIVGVARDARDHRMRGNVDRRFYVPYYQPLSDITNANFIVRSVGDPATLATQVRGAVQHINPKLDTGRATPVNELIEDSLFGEVVLAKLVGFFAGLALLLACIGLYGVLSYTVAGRTREIGVRMALGAQRPDVLLLIVKEAARLVAVGMLVGVPAALASARLISSFLFGLSPIDPVSIFGATAVLAAVATFAGYVPARRATRVDPMIALRYE